MGFSRKTRGELMRAELGESWDHLLAAATHAANGVGQSVGPSTRRMRGMATRGWDSLAPMAEAYRQGAADATAAALRLKSRSKARRKGRYDVSNRRTGMLIGLLAAGAVVGAASALVMRRRRRQHWSEYEPTDTLDSMTSDARSMVDKAASRGTSTMDKMSQQAGKAMDKAGDKLHSAASSMRKSDYKSKADEASEAANEATDDFQSKLP